MRKWLKFFWIAIKGEEKNFTSGSINRALVLLATPMILEMAMEALFAIVDIFFVSRLGDEDAIATIGLTESVMYIVISIAVGLGAAATAMIARRIGENNHEAAAIAAVQAIFISVLVSVLLGIAGFIYAPDLLSIMGGSEKMVETGLPYTRIILSLNIVLVLIFVINAIFRGAGDASIAMRSLWLANGLNIILDPCLIFGLGPFPELGLKGAAIATCTGRGLAVVYQCYYLFNGKSIIKISVQQIKFVWNIIWRLIQVSIGGAGQHIIASASWIFLIRIIANFGSEALAGYTIAMRVIMFTLLPSWGLAMAAATLVGQNLGAGHPERAEKSAWKAAFYNMLFLFIISIAFLLFARPIITLFSDNEVVIQNGVLALKIICAGYIFYAYEMVLGQSFNGAGDTYTPTLLNFICFWLIQIPLAYILAISLNMGTTGVYITVAISSSILAMLAIWVFKKGRWKTVQI